MIPVNILAVRYLTGASNALCDALEIPSGYHSLGILTTDCDDATYIALDEATKAADVLVSYGRSFYAGAANATTPNAGEVIGILAGKTPGAVRSGMEAAVTLLQHIGFETAGDVPYLAWSVNRSGAFLSKEADVPEGTPLAYLIAPPLESICGLDAALKASDVKLCKFYHPPSETNFGGGLLCGTPAACQAACEAFAQTVAEIAKNPKGE